jgi:tRNA A-37 threonylcarbamoyl transferase component Bud32
MLFSFIDRSNDMTKRDYISANWSDLLNANGLNDFESLWEIHLEKVDEPNIGRGGWSQAFVWSLSAPNGIDRKIVVKRQQNYTSRTPAHPLKGIPTLRKEYRNIKRCHQLGIPTVNIVYYGFRNTGDGLRAILITEYLGGYIDANQLAYQWYECGITSLSHRIFVIQEVASVIRKLHCNGLQHGHLQPKHILIKMDNSKVSVRLLDLENLRSNLIWNRHRVVDLSTLNRRIRFWSNSDKLRFLRAYLGIDRLDRSARRLCHRILRRTTLKNRQE